MNKLSKIVIISSLAVIGGAITLGSVVLSQESNSDLNLNPPLENRDRRVPRSNRDNPDLRNNIESTLPSSERNMPTKNMDARSRNIEQKNKRIEEKPSTRSETNIEREQQIKDKCDTIGSKILNHQNNFTSQSEDRINKYNKINTKLDSILPKLEDKGIDSVLYSSYITELKSKITDLDSLNEDYTKLFVSKSKSEEFCNNKEQLLSEVNTRKAKLQLVVAKDKEIRIYIKETIIPYLRSLNTVNNTSTDNNQIENISPTINPDSENQSQ